MTNPFKLFFVPIILIFSKFFPQLQLPRPSTSAEAVDSEVVAPLAAGANAVDQTEAAGNGAKKQAQDAGLALVHHMEWEEIVIGSDKSIHNTIDILITMNSFTFQNTNFSLLQVRLGSVYFVEIENILLKVL